MQAQTKYPDWDEGSIPNKRAGIQRKAVLARVMNSDCKKLPSAKLVKGWHRDMFDGLVPAELIGNFRNLDKVPEALREVDVYVDDPEFGRIYGVHHDEVLNRVEDFITEFKPEIKEFDQTWRILLGYGLTGFAIDQMIKLAAWAHGEWIWIHPFINGNGRTARLWMNYVFGRYEFPAVDVRPRPDWPYDRAAARVAKPE